MLKEFRTLLPYIKQTLPRYSVGFVCLILTNAAQLAVPQLTKRAIDAISSGSFGLADILPLAVGIVAVGAGIALFRFAWRVLILGSAYHIELNLRDRLFGHLESLSSTFYGSYKTGDLMARFTNDLRAVRMGTGWALVAFVDGVFMTTAILIILIRQNPRLALIAVSPFPLITVMVFFFGRLIKDRFQKVQEGFSALSDAAQESFSGIRVLKTFVQEAAFVKRFVKRNREYSDRNMYLIRLWGVLFPAAGFLSGLTLMIFLFFGGRAVMEGVLTPGEFTAFLAYLGMLMWPMMGAGFTINLIQRANASMGRINGVLNEVPDVKSPENPYRGPVSGDIRFEGLSFTYPESEEPVLSDVSLEIKKGSVLGILGRTGAGKSTLVQILPRILDPPEGKVFIDGKDVRSYDLEVLRSAISVVPQDGFLFSDTIRRNIAFGVPEGEAKNGDAVVGDAVNREALGGPEDTIRRVAAISTIERDLKFFPSGWDTVIGERGVTLSGGQKQRVAISRSLAATGASIFILDDSFSSVDTDTEDTILREFFSFIRGKTVILISHRISTLKAADTVVVLDQGRIIQSGNHEELLAQGGFYADTFRQQQIEEALRDR